MQRPSSITVFGILNIIFALGGVGGILSSLNMFSPNSPAATNPVVEMMLQYPGYATWLKIASGPGIAAYIVLFAGGVSLLKFKAWGRKLSIGYGIYAILSCLVGLAVNFLYLVRPMLEQALQKQGAESAIMMTVVISVMLGSIMGLVYPIVLLTFMTRPWMKAAFRPAIPPPLPK